MSLERKIKEKQSREAEDYRILIQLRKDETKFREEIRPKPWNDLPPILSEENEDSLRYEVCAEILSEYWDNYLPNDQNAKIGEYYVEEKRNISGTLSIAKEKEKSLKEEIWNPKLEEEPEEKEVLIAKGYLIWEVIQPTHIYLLPNGKWSSGCWKPQIKDPNTGWINASPRDCENWSKIPLSEKRVSLCLGIFPEEVGAGY